jgi:hypothetical protein
MATLPNNYGTPTYAPKTGREMIMTGGGYTGMNWDDFVRMAGSDGNFQKSTLSDDPGANPFLNLNPKSTGQSYYIAPDPSDDTKHILMIPDANGNVTQMSVPKNNPAMMKAIAISLAAMGGGMAAGGAFGGAGIGAAGTSGTAAGTGSLGGGLSAAGAGEALGSGVTLGSGGATGITGGIGAGGSFIPGASGVGFSAAGASPAALGSLGPGFFAGETIGGLSAGAAGAAGGALASGASGEAGAGASGAGDAAASSASPGSFSDARFAANYGIDPAYVGSGTASNSLSSFLSGAKDILGNPLVSVGTSLVSGALANRAANKAADAQKAAAQSAIDEQRRQYDQTRTDLSPWRTRGVGASNRLAVMMGLSPDAASYGTGDPKQDPFWMKGYQTAPKYQPQQQSNRLGQMLNILNQSAGVK